MLPSGKVLAFQTVLTLGLNWAIKRRGSLVKQLPTLGLAAFRSETPYPPRRKEDGWPPVVDELKRCALVRWLVLRRFAPPVPMHPSRMQRATQGETIVPKLIKPTPKLRVSGLPFSLS